MLEIRDETLLKKTQPLRKTPNRRHLPGPITMPTRSRLQIAPTGFGPPHVPPLRQLRSQDIEPLELHRELAAALGEAAEFRGVAEQGLEPDLAGNGCCAVVAIAASGGTLD